MVLRQRRVKKLIDYNPITGLIKSPHHSINSYGKGYLRIQIKGVTIGLQQLAWVYINGKIPDHHRVKFKDGDKQNYKINNLYLSKYNITIKHKKHNNDYISQRKLKRIITYDEINGLFTGGNNIHFQGNSGYLKMRIEGKYYSLQQLAWIYSKGFIPKKAQIRFKDGNKQNFRLSNLYIVKRG